MKRTFASLYGATEGDLTDAEYAEAEQLVAEKFDTEEWLYRVP